MPIQHVTEQVNDPMVNNSELEHTLLQHAPICFNSLFNMAIQWFQYPLVSIYLKGQLLASHGIYESMYLDRR